MAINAYGTHAIRDQCYSLTSVWTSVHSFS